MVYLSTCWKAATFNTPTSHGFAAKCSHATWQRYTIEPKEWSRWHATTTRHVCFSNNIYYSPHYRRIVSKQGRARNRRNPGVIFTHTIVFFLATRPRTVDVIEISSEAGSARKSSCTKPYNVCFEDPMERLFCVVRNRLHLLRTKNLQIHLKLFGNMRVFD